MNKYSWYKISFKPVEFVKKINQLDEIIKKIFDNLTLQDEIAIFSPIKDNVHNLVTTWFFPPKTVKLIEQILKEYGAQRCEEPNIDSLNMYLGNDTLFDSYFTITNKN